MSQDILIKALDEIFKGQTLIHCVLSGPKPGEACQKIAIRPLLIKEKFVYQVTEFRGPQATHKNMSAQECRQFVDQRLFHFKQTFFYTAIADYQVLINKKGQPTLLKKSPAKSEPALSHNRLKRYALEEGTPIPFLIELGVMNREGKVYPQKSDKFKQINRFLEMIDDIGHHLDSTKTIRVIDFGCGKAYLTFALYHYLKFIKGLSFQLIGLDLKEDAIKKCKELALALGYQDLTFLLGDINDYEQDLPVEMVVSLHACDTATDAALEKAIRWQAKAILCVPCCQHELFNQVHSEELNPLFKHGILKERFASLATDAARAQLLEVMGYQTQVLEFIDVEHTPKNLLIRAIKRNQPISEELWKSYARFKRFLRIDPSLERRFNQELPDS